MAETIRQWRILYTKQGHYGGPPDENGIPTLQHQLFWQSEEYEDVTPRMIGDLLDDCRVIINDLVDAWLEWREVTSTAWTSVDREVRAGE